MVNYGKYYIAVRLRCPFLVIILSIIRPHPFLKK